MKNVLIVLTCWLLIGWAFVSGCSSDKKPQQDAVVVLPVDEAVQAPIPPEEAPVIEHVVDEVIKSDNTGETEKLVSEEIIDEDEETGELIVDDELPPVLESCEMIGRSTRSKVSVDRCVDKRERKCIVAESEQTGNIAVACRRHGRNH